MEVNKIEEIETQNTNWLKEEAENIKENAFDGERKPSLKLEENKMVTMTIDFSEQFQKWIDPDTDAIKKIIPVKVGEVE